MNALTRLSLALLVAVGLLAYTATALPLVGELEESDELGRFTEESDEFGRFLQESSASGSGTGDSNQIQLDEDVSDNSAMGATFSLVALAAAMLLV